MIVYAFKYCYCIYESSYNVESLHMTAKGAYKAMKEFRIKMFNEWRRKPNRYRKDYIDTIHQAWCVDKIEVKE